MSNARDNILGRLRASQVEFADLDSAETPLSVVPFSGSPDQIRSRFIDEARKLNASVLEVEDEAAAYDALAELIGQDDKILTWDASHIPLANFTERLNLLGVAMADANDATVRIGLTGADAALAATGSLVLMSSAAKPRSPSLLPPVHIAIVRQAQLVTTFEAWVQAQEINGLKSMREASNIIVISGPSRTADIGMELILGAHGPKELYIILVS